jgi:hypothetical protein
VSRLCELGHYSYQFVTIARAGPSELTPVDPISAEVVMSLLSETPPDTYGEVYARVNA